MLENSHLLCPVSPVRGGFKTQVETTQEKCSFLAVGFAFVFDEPESFNSLNQHVS